MIFITYRYIINNIDTKLDQEQRIFYGKCVWFFMSDMNEKDYGP